MKKKHARNLKRGIIILKQQKTNLRVISILNYKYGKVHGIPFLLDESLYSININSRTDHAPFCFFLSADILAFLLLRIFTVVLLLIARSREETA